MTWNHTRGYTSIIALSQRFEELTDGRVSIRWDKRSLQAFADEPIGNLADSYDFLVIDHPWTGVAAREHLLLPLDEHLPSTVIEDQRRNTVGDSFESYSMENHLWALPLDAAAPVASAREDLLSQHEVSFPDTWQQVLDLAQKGLVAFPSIPQDTLMNFYMMCSTLGEDPCVTEDSVVSLSTGRQALGMLRELSERLPLEAFHWNPIRTYEAMTRTDSIAYCPFAYGYVNYSIPGYARKALRFADTVRLAENGARLRTTIGGTGLAISAKTKAPKETAEFLSFAASSEVQKTLFFPFGGQPGHRAAWEDRDVNAASRDFFKSTLPTLDRSFLRPRYAGHMYFQDNAGAPIREYLLAGGDAEEVLEHLNELYRRSRSESYT